MLQLACIALTNLALAPTAMLHPGHGTTGSGWGVLHYLIEPAHLLGMTALMLLGVLTALFLWRRGRSRAGAAR